MDPTTYNKNLNGLADQLIEVAGDLEENRISREDPAVHRLWNATRAYEHAACSAEQPMERDLTAMARHMAVSLLVRWGVFDVIPDDDVGIEYSDLAAKVGVETTLLVRIIRPILSGGYVLQNGQNRIVRTRHCDLLSKDDPYAAHYYLGELLANSWLFLPKYFEKYGKVEPKNATATAYAECCGLPEFSTYDCVARDPVLVHAVAKFMSRGFSRPSLQDPSYDYRWVIEAAARQPERPMVVDVGGGKGHCLRRICKSTPGLDLTRCVLEDRAEVLDEVRKDPAYADVAQARLEVVDFFKEQPVSGALCYHIRQCLHNWNDESCVTILKHIAGAMLEDSRLLIVEQTVLENPTHVPGVGVAADWMMLCIGGKERTTTEFEELVAKVGLKISAVVRPRAEGEWSLGIVECVKV